jgi:regulator of nucleoside diphosphate kinase
MNPTQPGIFVSTTDFDRLTALLDGLPPGESDRLRRLAEELDRADILPPRDMPPDVVTMHSTVRFSIGAVGADLRLTLVYRDEVVGRMDRISVFAPVGCALLGLPAGARIDWPRPGGGMQTITIRDVT